MDSKKTYDPITYNVVIEKDTIKIKFESPKEKKWIEPGPYLHPLK